MGRSCCYTGNVMTLPPLPNAAPYFIFAFIGLSLMFLTLLYGLVVRALEDGPRSRLPRNRVLFRRHYTAVAVLFISGIALVLAGSVVGQVQSMKAQEQRTAQLQYEAKRVYGLVLSHDQATALYDSAEPVSLNDGSKVILQHKRGGTWVLATPNDPTPLTPR